MATGSFAYTIIVTTARAFRNYPGCTSDRNLRKEIPGDYQQLAVKLNVVRQTVSKWETDETLPDIRQSKRMAVMYHVSLDDLITYDPDIQEIQEMIEKTSDKVTDKVDWTKAWSKKYPILAKYQEIVNTSYYAREIALLLKELQDEYQFNDLDAMLVLKDILAGVWQSKRKLP